MQSGKFGRTDKQIDAHFLCSRCEDLFSKHGETAVSRLWGTHDGFPLFELLNATVPFDVNGRRRLYTPDQIPDELCSSIYYFAMSIFWRAVKWPVPVPGISSCKGILTLAQLGRLESFLLKPQSPVDEFFLMADINTFSEMNGIMSLPSRINSEAVNGMQFDILGIRFMLFGGAELPQELEFLKGRLNRFFVISTSDHSESRWVKQVARFLHDNDVD
ncbi:hypothetical protein [Pseudomonas sp.]|uniref:hypothetical protein n=1 Tax=Pseudomonas sp. TaxID=306 RepID=UPI0028B0F977|nr:hypothetical protein [Pseudomonas sp.]